MRSRTTEAKLRCLLSCSHPDIKLALATTIDALDRMVLQRDRKMRVSAALLKPVNIKVTKTT